jgi:hypothetical protein
MTFDEALAHPVTRPAELLALDEALDEPLDEAL